MGDVNFDEFQAIRRRKAQDDEEDEDQKEEPAATPKAEEEEEPDGLAERAGAFAELPEVQLLLCVAILADVAGAAVTAARDDGAPAFLVRAAAAFPGFVNFLYAFELLALATAFKLRMLTHPGLLLDVGIVSVPPASFVSSARRWRYEGRTSRRCRQMSGRRRRGSTAIARERLNWREMTPSRRAGPGRSSRRMARIDWTSTPQERERKKKQKKQNTGPLRRRPRRQHQHDPPLGLLKVVAPEPPPRDARRGGTDADGGKGARSADGARARFEG